MVKKRENLIMEHKLLIALADHMGSCEWCRSNRLYQQLKMEEASRQALEEMEDDK